MRASEIFTIHASCPCCGKMNSLTLGGVEAPRKLVCSTCKWPLATAADLVCEEVAPRPRVKVPA